MLPNAFMIMGHYTQPLSVNPALEETDHQYKFESATWSLAAGCSRSGSLPRTSRSHSAATSRHDEVSITAASRIPITRYGRLKIDISVPPKTFSFASVGTVSDTNLGIAFTLGAGDYAASTKDIEGEPVNEKTPDFITSRVTQRVTSVLPSISSNT